MIDTRMVARMDEASGALSRSASEMDRTVGATLSLLREMHTRDEVQWRVYMDHMRRGRPPEDDDGSV